MKKILVVALCVAMGVFTAANVFGFAGTFIPGNGINGTVHDIPTLYPAGGTETSGLNRICIYCHAPHNTYKLAGTGVGGGVELGAAYDYLPLWNHTVSLNDPSSFSMYNAGPGAPTTGHAATQAASTGMVPGSESMLCLSCHDGSVAVNSYGTSAWQPATSVSSGGGAINDSYSIGKDAYLGNHHPVGFVYDDVQAGDTEIRLSTTNMANYNGTITTIADHLYGTRVECGTCHSVHNKNNTGERLLWRSDTASHLCLTCHDKGTYTDPATAPDTTGTPQI